MSVWITPNVLPQEKYSLTHDDFTSLILRVLYEGHGNLPVIVASGLIAQSFQRDREQVAYVGVYPIPKDKSTSPYTVPVERYDNITGEATGEYGELSVWYHGDNRDILARTLVALPYDHEDVWVKFAGVDGPEFFVLTKECLVGFWNAWCPDDEMRKRTKLICELGGGLLDEDDVFTHPILPLLTEYFGEEIRVAYTYS